MATQPIFADEAARWAAVQRRDAAADGQFFYSVKTTGVYCRPSCAARPARRENVAFHADPAAAEAAGFRACKRCRPDGVAPAQARADAIAKACRLIEAAEELPDLDTLAAAAGMSRFHFHRSFKTVTGVTPKGYAAALRTERVQEALAAGSSVTAAIYDAGYNANSRFYADSASRLGMRPSAYRDGGRGMAIRFAVGDCSLGTVLVAATDKGVCSILLGDDPDTLVRDLQDRFGAAELVGGDADFEKTVAQVVGLIDAPGAGLSLPLDVRGTAFQQQVWEALRRIPAGRTASYAEIALAIGRPAAVRAVAQACGANSLAIAIPCHRVVRSDGDLSGYRWGVERKRELLSRERAAA
ncbi:bifunctional DNA-binding transcriptional regulator/O6-methylguanine-DNA methyltransferase Ada [Sphingoaurantiacus capsulatus]|uniref:Bifunctional DNA-binding transcriptional regulator/O6-methylguanine-DNA methyltransferase Ada n=1 Tax=Sphingoaurantiacus capsulatus TaxID=1771310 RepID=A0ABV7XCD1_9SPHN